MVPKSERFEMRLDLETIDKIDNWRAGEADLPSRAEAIRRLVDLGLAGTSAQSVLNPNQTEKLTLWLLTELLKHQKNYENKDTIELIQSAIYGGHYWALEWELIGLFHNHVDKQAAVSLVVDTLDMWDWIERASDNFGSKEEDLLVREIGTWAKKPRFIGFDGNTEGEYLSVARFLVEKMGRFERFKGRSFNSHSPSVARNADMVAKFEAIRPTLMGRELSAGEVVDIMKRG